MPLLKGSGQSVIDANIRELRNAGKPERQAIAIALKHAGKGKKRKSLAVKVAKHNSLKVYGT